MFQLREENAELKRRVSSSETNKGKILSTIVAEYDILLKEAKQEAVTNSHQCRILKQSL